MRLIQFTDMSGGRHVGLVSGNTPMVHVLDGVESVYALAREAIEAGSGIGSPAPFCVNCRYAS